MRMKRRDFIKGAGLAAGASAVAGPAVAQSMPGVKWRCTSSFPKTLDIFYETAEVFAKAVAEATDNRFQIQVFPPGEIVPGLAAADAVTAGTVEMCHTASYYYVAKDPAWAFGTAVPFGLNSRMQNAWMYFGGGMELLNDFYKKANIYAIPCGNTGCQMGGWFRKEIREAADLNGLKFRIGGYAGLVVQKLGCIPQPIGGAEIYGALEKGVIDGAEWVGPYDDEKLNLHKVAPYYYYPAWWEGAAMLHNFINLDKWNALPPAYKAVVRQASDMAHGRMQAKYDSLNPVALRKLVLAGARLMPFPAPVMDACLNAALDLYRDVSAANPEFKKLYEAMAAFRKDQYLWWQVAEYSYDTFMIRSRSKA
jgi:TRAP-type mannitol/chloroaromatic compound transport system substrate-binding protein